MTILRFLLAASLLLFNLVFLHAQDKSIAPQTFLNYHLGWDGKSSILKVSLEYTPATKDSTVFIYGNPNFGGQKEIFKVLQNIDTKDKIRLTPGERKITVYHTDSGLKKISYTINGHLVGNPKRATVDELFRPLITPDFLYLVPLFFMINPVGHAATTAGIQWDSFPAGLPYFISIDAGTAPNIQQTIPLNKELDVLILMGTSLVIKSYYVNGIPYYSITCKRDTINNLKSALKPFFKKYFPGQRNFWKDNGGSYYYISILPLLSIDKPWATGYSQKLGFVMRYSGKFDDEKKRVIAHETSHYWIGNNMQIGNDEFDNQWFGEGFTDYVMLMNLVKSGIEDKTVYLEYINESNFLEHYSSPVKNAPNDSIAAHFWYNKDYQTLPYRRGFIYAFYFDNQIRLASGGKKTIRDFLLALLKRNQEIHAINPAANLTLDDYIAIASKFLPENQVRSEIETYMIKGDPLDFKTIKLIDGFTIDYRDSIPELKISKKINLKKIYAW